MKPFDVEYDAIIKIVIQVMKTPHNNSDNKENGIILFWFLLL